MADLLNVVRNVNRFTPAFRKAGTPTSATELTESDITAMPYVNQAKSEFEEKRKRKGFLAVIFDVLQAGNFASANAFDAIHDAVREKKPIGEAIIDTFEGVWKGLTLQEKNTFSDMIKENVEQYGDFLGGDEEFWNKPLLGVADEAPTGKVAQFVNAIRRQLTPAGLAGLAGDIFLDPLTYVNPWKFLNPVAGASQGALSAGAKYADDVVRLDLLNKNLSALTKMVGSADVAKRVQDIAEAGGDILPQLQKVIQTSGNVEFSRYLDDLVRSAQKKGTLTPAAKLQGEMTEGIGQATRRFENLAETRRTKQLDKMAEAGKPYSEAISVLEEPLQVKAPGALETLRESIERGYSGAGTRANRSIFGEGMPVEKAPNVIAQTFDRFGELVKGKVGGVEIPGAKGATLSDAWWAFMNRPGSPVGFVKKAFGIRNPYQQLMHQKMLDAQAYGHSVSSKMIPEYNAALADLGDELQATATQVRMYAETAEFAARKADTAVMDTASFIEANKKLLVDRFGMDEADVEKVRQFWKRTDALLETMRQGERELIEKGLLPDYEAIINYMPKYQQNLLSKGKAGRVTGTATPGFTEATKFTGEQSTAQMAQQYRLFYGDMFAEVAQKQGIDIDKAITNYIVENNVAPVSLDLAEIFNRRIVAHARAMQRGNMIEKFREFGIRFRDLGFDDLGDVKKKKLMQGIARTGGSIPSLGLYSVTDPGFAGYLFDKELTDIITKTYAATSSDQAISTMKNVIGTVTQWWKGWATATSGFHMRNHFSNDFTGFMRHGMDWFNPKKYTEAAVLAHYALYPQKYADMAKEALNVGDGFVTRALNRQISGVPVKDLVDYARDKGLVGWGSFFSEVEKRVTSPTAHKLRQAVGFSQENIALKGSRAVGDLLETKAKLQSFLETFEQVTKGQLDEGVAMVGDAVVKNASALEWAKLDTQKWFINYNDLTEFERKYLRPVAPFYTWLRKNMANQINGLVMYPGAYALVAKGTEEFTLEGFPMVLMPEWQQNLGYIPVSQDENGQYIMFFPNLPYQDLNKIPLEWEEGALVPRVKGEEFWQELSSNAHPVIKTIVERITNKNTFAQRDYLDQVEAPGLAQFLAKSPWVLGRLDGMMRLAGRENGIRVDERNGKVVMDEFMQRVLETNLPVLRFIENIVDAGIDVSNSLIPGVEEAITAATGRTDDHEGLEDMLQALAYFGGVKFKMFQEEFERDQVSSAIEERANELQRAERRKLPGYDQRIREYGRQEAARRVRRGLY